ncbi:CapA family protein [Parapedobacter sp.]
MKIAFTGDLFLGGELDGKVNKESVPQKLFSQFNCVVSNLESPLAEEHLIPAEKGVLFANPKSGINLRNWGITTVSLANNHLQDKGQEGIKQTIETLNNYEVSFFGGGRNIREAKRPHYLTENLCIIGYCQFDAPTLTIIEKADNDKGGVNPLSRNNIINDLNNLPDTHRAILHFHWGQEHLWFPQPDIIKMGMEILKHPKVVLIIGMHPHRIQGFIKDSKKKCFFCLGNFLFPNFFISPPAQLSYPTIVPKNVLTTRQYHSVSRLTYKKWKIVNRISYIVEFDTASFNSRIIPVYQLDKTPRIIVLKGIPRLMVLWFIHCLSCIYSLPRGFYVPIHQVNKVYSERKWRSYNMVFRIREKGLSWFFRKLFLHLTRNEK